MSAGLSIVARCSAEGGNGRSSKIGVSTSPGKMVVTRMPFSRSSSVALVPMSGNETFGLLALGSPDEQHFAPENGDLFLSLFARTLSLWLSQNTE